MKGASYRAFSPQKVYKEKKLGVKYHIRKINKSVNTESERKRGYLDKYSSLNINLSVEERKREKIVERDLLSQINDNGVNLRYAWYILRDLSIEQQEANLHALNNIREYAQSIQHEEQYSAAKQIYNYLLDPKLRAGMMGMAHDDDLLAAIRVIEEEELAGEDEQSTKSRVVKTGCSAQTFGATPRYSEHRRPHGRVNIYRGNLSSMEINSGNASPDIPPAMFTSLEHPDSIYKRTVDFFNLPQGDPKKHLTRHSSIPPLETPPLAKREISVDRSTTSTSTTIAYTNQSLIKLQARPPVFKQGKLVTDEDILKEKEKEKLKLGKRMKSFEIIRKDVNLLNMKNDLIRQKRQKRLERMTLKQKGLVKCRTKSISELMNKFYPKSLKNRLHDKILKGVNSVDSVDTVNTVNRDIGSTPLGLNIHTRKDSLSRFKSVTDRKELLQRNTILPKIYPTGDSLENSRRDSFEKPRKLSPQRHVNLSFINNTYKDTEVKSEYKHSMDLEDEFPSNMRYTIDDTYSKSIINEESEEVLISPVISPITNNKNKIISRNKKFSSYGNLKQKRKFKNIVESCAKLRLKHSKEREVQSSMEAKLEARVSGIRDSLNQEMEGGNYEQEMKDEYEKYWKKKLEHKSFLAIVKKKGLAKYYHGQRAIMCRKCKGQLSCFGCWKATEDKQNEVHKYFI